MLLASILNLFVTLSLKGRKFDHSGHFHLDNETLWDLSSINEYKKKSDCFVRHYSNYTIANLGQKVILQIL